MTVDTVNIKILNAEVKAMFEEDMKEVDTTSVNGKVTDAKFKISIK